MVPKCTCDRLVSCLFIKCDWLDGLQWNLHYYNHSIHTQRLLKVCGSNNQLSIVIGQNLHRKNALKVRRVKPIAPSSLEQKLNFQADFRFNTSFVDGHTFEEVAEEKGLKKKYLTYKDIMSLHPGKTMNRTM